MTSDHTLPWVPILMYHRVVPSAPAHDPHGICVTTAAFEAHLRWLARRGYTGVPLDSVLGNRSRPGGGPPGRRVVITLDDGYEDNYLYAWPLLRRHHFTATVFVVSDAIGGANDFDADSGSEPARMLSDDQMRSMHAGGIGFGSHTRCHPADMTALPDARVTDELGGSRRVLEGILDSPVLDFCYPHARLDARVESLVRAAGYRSGCAGVGTRFSPFCLHRVAVSAGSGPHLELEMLRRRAKHGVWRGLSRVSARWRSR